MPENSGFLDPEVARKATRYVADLQRKMEDVVRPAKAMADHIKDFVKGLLDGATGGQKVADVMKSVMNTAAGFAAPLQNATQWAQKLASTSGNISGPLKQGMADITAATERASGAATRLNETMSRFGVVGLAGVVALAQGIRNFARAGMESTGIGVLLTFHFQQMGRSVAAILLPAFQALIDIVNRLTQFFRGLSASQQNALQGLVVGFGVAKVAAMALGGPLGLIAGVIAAITLGTTRGQGVLGQLGETFSKLLEATKPLLDALGTLFGAVLTAMKPAIDAISGLIAGLAPIFSDLVEGLQPVISAIGDIFTEIMSAIADVLPDIVSMLAQLGKAFATVFAAIIPLVKPLIDIVLTIIKAWMPAFKIITDMIAHLAPIIANLFHALEPAIKGIADAFKAWMDAMEPVIELLATSFAATIEAVVNGVVGAYATIAVLAEKASKVKDAIKSASPTELAVSLAGMLDVGNIGKEIAEKVNAMSRPTPKAEKGAKPDDKPGRDVLSGRGSFEDIRQQFRRIQEAPMTMAKGPEEKTAEATAKTAEKVGGIWEFLIKHFGSGASFEPPDLPRPQEGK